jgi:hypothetical protein
VKLIEESPQGKSLLSQVAKAHEDLVRPRRPERLVLNPAVRSEPCEGGVGLRSFSRFDALVVPKELYDALGKLGPAEPAKATLERLGVPVDDARLHALWMHEIVIAAPDVEPARRVAAAEEAHATIIAPEPDAGPSE